MPHPQLEQFKNDALDIIESQGQEVTIGATSLETLAVVDASPDLAGLSPSGLSSEFGYPQARWAVFLVHVDDVVGRPQKDKDTVIWDGETFTVRQTQPRMGGALWKLWCSTDERGGLFS